MDQFIIINNPAAVGNGPARSSIKYQKRNNLSVIIGSYKSTITKQINRINRNYTFKWQKSFHDHIIRIDESLNNICNYIINNPTTWGMDENNIQNYSLEVQAGLNPTGAIVITRK